MTGQPAAAAFPWAELMRVAVMELGIRPGEFWRLTVRELAMLLRPAGPAGDAMSRARLGRLMKEHPDG